jgi:hypothetical protein
VYEANADSAVSATSGLSSTTCPRCKAASRTRVRTKHGGRRGIPIQKVNEAFERLSESDVKYRFCIDMASLEFNNQPDI